MAAAVHACSSPRQRHSLTSNVDCLQLQHKTTATMYTTMPKYTRTSGAPLSAPSHHVYGSAVGGGGCGGGGGGGNVTTNQYGSPMYMSLGPAATGSASSSQPRPLSASAAMPDAACRSNYWSHQHPATMMYRSGRHYSKRKSAVELLAESKPFYIRSDALLDRLQQSNYRSVSGTPIVSSAKRGRRPDDGRYNPSYGEIEERRYGTAPHVHHQSGRAAASTSAAAQQTQHLHHHHHHGHHTHASRHSVPTNNNLLQNKLRMLLGAEASKERIVGGRNSLRKYELNGSRNELSTAGYDDDESSALRMPPPMYMSPQTAYNNAYGYVGECSSGGEEPLVLTENYRPISPPAEYAAKSSQTNNERYRYNYQRSYSHSHEMGGNERAQYAAVTADYSNINSHKSLPDLHTQISRHSPHSEILSCCSRGNRSIKSAGESSLNRDSGGSSGHYTHRSEPCYQRQREAAEREINPTAAKNCCNAMVTRRDSGSSTQHSANSYCGYATPAAYPPPPLLQSGNGSRVADCGDCRCKHETITSYNDSSDYLLNFTTPEVPEAFQDDYTPPSPRHAIKELTPRYSSSSSQQHHSSQGYTSINHSQSSLVQSPGSAPSIEDISPPPIQFKRQRCIRFKNRSRYTQPRTSLQSECTANGGNTGLGVGYQRAEHDNVFFPKGFTTDEYQLPSTLPMPPPPPSHAHHAEKTRSAEHASCSSGHGSMDLERDAGGLCDLEKFFDRLGLNDEAFHEIYSQPKRRHSAESDSDDSSTVFFSDVSTVDSMRLPDSTETQPQTAQPYRPSEPPSIVERNARIIKWLCNCKKLQYA